MNFTIYAIKDKLTNRFMQPFYLRNEQEAKRLFASQLNNIDIWKENPEQFILYELGTFNEELGFMTMDNIEICKGSDLIG